MTVIKRNRPDEPFRFAKIAAAVTKAFNACGVPVMQEVLDCLRTKYDDTQDIRISVDEIHDEVENVLMKFCPRVAKAYIIYRYEHKVVREYHEQNPDEEKPKEAFEETVKHGNEEIHKTYLDIVNVKANDVTRENANMNADTPAGMMMKFASEATKPFVDECLLSEESLESVRKNYIHIHDKDYYPTKSFTCVQHPLDNILNNGFYAGHGASRPAKRIETASVLACISLERAQNEMHGGQAIPAFDFYLAPYVRYTFIEEVKKLERLMDEDYSSLYERQFEDYVKKPLDGLTSIERAMQHAMNETVSRVHQAMEAFIHNMNVIHSRGGNQVVFSSINYGTDTSAEGRCVMRELLISTYEGVGNGETAIFPIQIWKKKRGVNYLPEDKNYDLYQLACKVTARRFFPNFLNLDSTFNTDPAWDANDPKRYLHEVASMGCRTRVSENRYGPRTSVGRGNLSFTTINIVRLAIECMTIKDKQERINRFFEKLDEQLDIAAKQLDERFQFQKTAFAKQFPLVMKYLWNGGSELSPNDTVEKVINQGTLGIGFIGLAECLVALIGKHHGESDEAQELGLKIVTYMRDKVNAFSEQYQHNYSVLATPAEGLSGKFTKKDKEQFGIIPGVTDRDYYTNSNHVPVYYKCTARHKAEIEAPYHDLTRGGHIFYVEIDSDATHNPQAIMKIVDMMDEYNMGYGSVNHNRNRCMDCGYENASLTMEVCPKCGSHNIDRLQRITGYLVGTTDRWNHAKLSELNDRVTHMGGSALEK